MIKNIAIANREKPITKLDLIFTIYTNNIIKTKRTNGKIT